MIIAVIDDGVNPDFYSKINLEFDLSINKKNEVTKRIRYDKSCGSHGTTCAAIIKKYAPDARLGSIKILSNKTGRGKAKHLIKALEWCAENNIKIAHMSVGSTLVHDIEGISEAVKQFQNNGGIIVSALTNTMKWSIPACLPDVISVKTDKAFEGKQYHSGGKGLYDVSFVASSRHALVDCFGNEHITQCSNSYSAPMITALVYKALCDNPDTTATKLCEKLGGVVKGEIEEQINNTILSTVELDIPIISISGEFDKAFEVAKRLNELFLKHQYPSIICSDEKLENINWLPYSNAKQMLSTYAQMLSLSVIIVVSNNDKWRDSLADCWVLLKQGGQHNKYDGDTICLPEIPTINNLKNALSYFEKISE